jgi:hypothetical protein
MRCTQATATRPATKLMKVPISVGRKMSAALKPTRPCSSRQRLADRDHRGRDQRDARGVEHQEHDHRVAGHVLVRVDLLQLAHRLQAQRRGGVVQPQHVGAEVHHDAAAGRVAARNVGEQAPEQRVHGAREELDHAGLLAHLHDAQPQAHHADQAERDVEAGLGGVEQARQHLGEDGRVALQRASLTSATTKPIRMKATQMALRIMARPNACWRGRRRCRPRA